MDPEQSERNLVATWQNICGEMKNSLESETKEVD